MTTLQTVSGISARIFQLPDRPPFMVAADLAEVYATTVKAINQAVKRNPERFPEDFYFILTEAESEYLRSQNVTTNMARALPSAFTHAGAYALSAVLKTTVAAEVSVIVHRAFAAMEKRALEDTRRLLLKVQIEATIRKASRVRVIRCVEAGMSFDAMWKLSAMSRAKLAEMTHDCFKLGLINQLPAGIPALDLAVPAGEQPDLFAE